MPIFFFSFLFRPRLPFVVWRKLSETWKICFPSFSITGVLAFFTSILLFCSTFVYTRKHQKLFFLIKDLFGDFCKNYSEIFFSKSRVRYFILFHLNLERRQLNGGALPRQDEQILSLVYKSIKLSNEVFRPKLMFQYFLYIYCVYLREISWRYLCGVWSFYPRKETEDEALVHTFGFFGHSSFLFIYCITIVRKHTYEEKRNFKVINTLVKMISHKRIMSRLILFCIFWEILCNLLSSYSLALYFSCVWIIKNPMN